MAALSWQGDWVKSRGRREWGFESYRTLATESGRATAKAHVSFFYSNNKPSAGLRPPGGNTWWKIVSLRRREEIKPLPPPPPPPQTVFLRIVMCIKRSSSSEPARLRAPNTQPHASPLCPLQVATGYLCICDSCPPSWRSSAACSQSSPPRTLRTTRFCGCFPA